MSKLKDIAISISSGLTPSRKNILYWDKKDYFWLKTEQLGAFQIYETNEYISSKALKETSLKIYPINTISVAMYGEGKTRGSVSILKNEMATNQACCNIVVNKEKADYRYIYYYLKNSYFRLRSLSSGVRKNLNTLDIKEFSFKNIDIFEQKKIGNLLETLDKKIETNNKINKNLEEQLQLLYDYWFTQFDFPDENNQPYQSSGGKMVWSDELNREIPEGWCVEPVTKLLDIITGKENANHATPNGKYKFFTCSQSESKCDDYKFNGKAILIAGNGDFNVKHYSGKFNAYQRTYVLIPKNDIYYTAIYLVSKGLINKFKSGSNGSIVKFITKGDVENIKIIVPNNLEYYKILNKMIENIEINRSENEKLISLRDFLLPLLMNGQAKIVD